ncbi:MAG: hypothetical protein H8E51_07040 [Bacteroidetes bacterium]|nr:hypothetical protein [Bacteroidota bacterium]
MAKLINLISSNNLQRIITTVHTIRYDKEIHSDIIDAFREAKKAKEANSSDKRTKLEIALALLKERNIHEVKLDDIYLDYHP